MNKRNLIIKYILYDIIAALITWVLFTLFRRAVNDELLFSTMQIFTPNYSFFTSLYLFLALCVFVNYLTGFYIHPYRQSMLNVVLTTIVSSLIVSFGIYFVLLIDDSVVSYEFYYYSLLVLIALLFFMTLIFRSLISSEVRSNYKSKKWTINTIVIGTGNKAAKIADELKNNCEENTFIGYVSANKVQAVSSDLILGNMNQISKIIADNKIESAVVALDDAEETEIFGIINLLYKYNIDIQFTPRLFEILIGSAKIKNLEMSPLVSITNSSLSDWEASLKRFLDIVVSFISLVILSPFLLYFMILIKKDSKGPVFYRQERIGRYGHPFDILKFRSMYYDSENGVPKLSSANDDRVTNVGRVLRKYRIDEIPQFWNILKGDMSLVGPRPERKFYINQIVDQAPYYCLLYKIRPGLTSWGPIKIGYSDTIEKMIERLNYDIIYMDNMSLMTDLKILIYTFEILFKGKGV